MYVDARGREAYDEVAGKLGIEAESDEFFAAMKRHEEMGG